MTLLAPTRQRLAWLATLVDGQPGLSVGPRLLLDAGAAAPPLLTPVGLLDASAVSPHTSVMLLSDTALLARPRPCLVALVEPDDLLCQRLLLAAPLSVSAVGPTSVDSLLLAMALRVVALPSLASGAQLWFGGLPQPPTPHLARGQGDLELLRLLLTADKLAEVAGALGYTRRGLQAQVAAISRRLGVVRRQGRSALPALADDLLAALAHQATASDQKTTA